LNGRLGFQESFQSSLQLKIERMLYLKAQLLKSKNNKFQYNRYKKLSEYWYDRGDAIHGAICKSISDTFKTK
jgi:hypothetical protein